MNRKQVKLHKNLDGTTHYPVYLDNQFGLQSGLLKAQAQNLRDDKARREGRVIGWKGGL